MDKKTKALCLRASVFGFAHLLKSVRVHSNTGVLLLHWPYGEKD